MGTTTGKTTVTTVMEASLNGLASGAWAASAIEVEGGDTLYADFEAAITWAAGGNPTAGGTLDLYAIPCYDGASYVDGSASTVPQAALKVGSFIVRAASPQRLAAPGARLPCCEKLKFVLQNNTGRDLAATAGTVRMVRYLRA